MITSDIQQVILNFKRANQVKLPSPTRAQVYQGDDQAMT
jgi:hypothetical protein